ncbi:MULTISPECIES: alpha/beta fold hydrolase [unclassified Pseudofrankia]|uniref:alpha/beta fold hydrolase n=1 Tax=unclassified Pseudofrankia TaxID=2994372 RepID=UPI0008DAE509|nr:MULTISPECIES: alpha/beta hydrolase [unclassified Pseudofrankia]MDT3442232.1 alpha/beta hydrolase [Pseudofrankia sp. BMG5.37]OHV43559.1 hypothetical protein BCD48_27670 [Pseudofrankia sp. BMG5.36]
MATFLFVHGGFHGGWCWKRMADRLRKLGHEVYTPTLTGLGERAHLLRPDIDLETHIADVIGVLEWEDLHDVNLVGHSYAGAVITGVADRARDRVGRLVYFDALWPEDGETVGFLIGGEEATAGVLANVADEKSAPLLAAGTLTAQMMGITDPDDLAWVAARLTPQPPATLTQPVRLSGPLDVPVLAVICTASPHTDPGMKLSHERARAAAAVNPSVQVVTVAGPHDAMITHPIESADLLHRASVGPARRHPDRASGERS